MLLLIPYAYVSIESIDCIILSSFAIKKILLVNSVQTLYLSLLSLCCAFCIVLRFTNSLSLYTLNFFFSK